MIAKAIKGKGFRGALEYDLGKEQGHLIDSNMEGRTPRELAREFGEIRKLRPTLGKVVLHVSLSAAPGEHLSDATWAAIAQRYLAGMGLTANQYVMTRHEDTEHEHIHLVVNRITFDGHVVSDSHDYRRQEATMREVERDYHLQPVQASKDVMRRAATQREIEGSLRTGTASTKQRLQHLCDVALEGCRGYSEYAERLEAAGVQLVPAMQLNDAKLSGLSYVLDGVMMKGSDLGRGYSPMGLFKRGASYEQGRDIAAVSRQREREEARRLVAANRDTAHREVGERGAIGFDPGALGAGHGGANGRNASNDGRSASERAATGRTNQSTDRERGESVPAGGDGGPAFCGSLGQRGAGPGAESPLHGNSNGHHVSAARERIMALASPATEGAEPTGPKAGGRTPRARDRSYEAVQRQVAGMGCARYEVLLVKRDGEARQKRDWTEKQLLESVPWLKRMNARGHDVLVRPSGRPRLVMLDRLTEIDVAKIENSGVPCRAKIQVEENQFQIWFHFGDSAVGSAVRREMTKRLGLPNLEGENYGALAGFVKHLLSTEGNRKRFVLAHEPPRLAPEMVAKWGHRLEDAEKIVGHSETHVKHITRGRSR